MVQQLGLEGKVDVKPADIQRMAVMLTATLGTSPETDPDVTPEAGDAYTDSIVSKFLTQGNNLVVLAAKTKEMGADISKSAQSLLEKYANAESLKQLQADNPDATSEELAGAAAEVIG